MAQITGLGIGVNRFEWAVSNGVCPATKDTVSIFVTGAPVANAGLSLLTCADTISLKGVAVGSPASGTWSLVSGSGTIASPSLANSFVTNLAPGPNVFRWTVTAPTCPEASDTMVVYRVADTFTLGSDTTICVDSTLTINLGNLYSSVVWQDGSNLPVYTIDTSGTYFVSVTTAGNCVFTDTLVVGITICTGVDPSLAAATKVSVYPNPFRNNFHLEVDGFKGRELRYSLFTLNGAEVHSGSAYSVRGSIREEILPGVLPQGMYILEMTLGDRKERIKLVKQ